MARGQMCLNGQINSHYIPLPLLIKGGGGAWHLSKKIECLLFGSNPSGVVLSGARDTHVRLFPRGEVQAMMVKVLCTGRELCDQTEMEVVLV